MKLGERTAGSESVRRLKALSAVYEQARRQRRRAHLVARTLQHAIGDDPELREQYREARAQARDARARLHEVEEAMQRIWAYRAKALKTAAALADARAGDGGEE